LTYAAAGKLDIREMTDPIVSAALQEWDRRINDKRFAISGTSFELKQRWRDEVSGTLKDIVRAENSFLKLRDYLTNAVVTTSYYQVLMQHPRDENGNPISSISHPKLSWQLADHILEIAHKDKKLRRFGKAHGDNVKELLDYVRFNYESNYAYLSAMNAVRTLMKDISDDEDWLPQFYIAMCIWQEEMVRKEIGTSSLFDKEQQSKGLAGIKYWAFKKFVKSGSKFPHRDWQQLYGSDLLEASFVVPRRS
jgi:hypothetical protein